MPIALCSKCLKPIPDSYHDFNEVCECINWRAMAKEKGWDLKFPNKGVEK